MSNKPIPQTLLKYLNHQIENLSPEWYRIKTQILTSTNVAAVLEYDVYKTKLDMFNRKVNQENTLATSEAILWGLKYEPVARQLCAERHGLEIYETGLKQHSNYPFLGATPDGISYSETNLKLPDTLSPLIAPPIGARLHEFKCLKSRQITRQIPLEYWVQMQIAMEVWDIESCLYSENVFQEYSDYSEYLRDTRTADHNKGILPVGTNLYVGTHENESGIVQSEKPYYWYLKDHWDYLVVRNSGWVNMMMPKILDFWSLVLNEQRIRKLPVGFPLTSAKALEEYDTIDSPSPPVSLQESPSPPETLQESPCPPESLQESISPDFPPESISPDPGHESINMSIIPLTEYDLPDSSELMTEAPEAPETVEATEAPEAPEITEILEENPNRRVTRSMSRKRKNHSPSTPKQNRIRTKKRTSGDSQPLKLTSGDSRPLKLTSVDSQPLNCTSGDSQPLKRTSGDNRPLKRTSGDNRPLKRTRLASQPQKAISYQFQNLDWSECIRATQLNSFLKKDPILDWLELFGSATGYQKDPSGPFQMHSFAYSQSNLYKLRLVEFLKGHLDQLKLPYYDVFCYPELENVTDPILIGYNYHSIYYLNRTKEAMQRQTPIIFNGLLLHPQAQIFGRADLIIKEDLLKLIFPDLALAQTLPNSDLYVAVSLKFATLDLNSTGTKLLNNEKQKFYQLQSIILSQTLSSIQSKQVNRSYIISRRLKCNKLEINSTDANRNLFRLEVENHPLEKTLWEGVTWLRNLKKYGLTWEPEKINQPDYKLPPIPGFIFNSNETESKNYLDNLRPNLKNRYDAPWHHAKKHIAQTQLELTTVLNLGHRYRQLLIQNHGITRWVDLTLDALKAIRLPNAELVWKTVKTNIDQTPIDLTNYDPKSLAIKNQIEFFIDFETVNDLYDDFTQVPKSSGYDMIYLIGCVVLDHGNPDPQYHCFVVDDLTSNSEDKMLTEFFEFVHLTMTQAGQNPNDPAVFYHWTQAESLHLDKALNRYPNTRLQFELIDLYKIFTQNQITLTGAFNYGLKSVAKAFYNHGLIATTWKDGLDGAQASVGAWRAMDECKQLGVSKMSETRTIQTLIDYNYNDCRVLYEMTDFLRRRIEIVE